MYIIGKTNGELLVENIWFLKHRKFVLKNASSRMFWQISVDPKLAEISGQVSLYLHKPCDNYHKKKLNFD